MQLNCLAHGHTSEAITSLLGSPVCSKQDEPSVPSLRQTPTGVVAEGRFFLSAARFPLRGTLLRQHSSCLQSRGEEQGAPSSGSSAVTCSCMYANSTIAINPVQCLAPMVPNVYTHRPDCQIEDSGYSEQAIDYLWLL